MNAVDPYASCPYPPGSRGKVEWLAARFRLRLPLFQPGDVGDVDTPAVPQGLFARMEATGQSGPLDQPAARQLVEAVARGELSASFVAGRLGVDRRTVRDHAARLRVAEHQRDAERLQTA